MTLFNLKFQARVHVETLHKIYERLQNSQQNCEQGGGAMLPRLSTMIYVCGMLTNFNDAYIAEIRSELRKLTPL